MMIPARKYTVLAIQERLSQGPLSEIDFARFEKAAKKEIQGEFPANGLAALGILACLRGDLGAMHDFHNRAILTDDAAFMQTFNYATSLCQCRLFNDALDLAAGGFAKDKLNLDLLYVIIRAEYCLNMIDEAAGHIKVWNTMAKKPHPLAVDIQETLEDRSAVGAGRAEIARGEFVSMDELMAACAV